jgi:hypothetical protein
MSTTALILTGGSATRVVGRNPHPLAADSPAPRTVARFAGTTDMRRVAFPARKWDPFLNVNTPDDLAVARSLTSQAEECQP